MGLKTTLSSSNPTKKLRLHLKAVVKKDKLNYLMWWRRSQGCPRSFGFLGRIWRENVYAARIYTNKIFMFRKRVLWHVFSGKTELIDYRLFCFWKRGNSELSDISRILVIQACQVYYWIYVILSIFNNIVDQAYTLKF